jgi:hypothetical protein
MKKIEERTFTRELGVAVSIVAGFQFRSASSLAGGRGRGRGQA